MKKDSEKGVSLWILRNFEEKLFYRTLLDDCLCFILLDRVVLASSGEEVLFTDSDVEPELDIKVTTLLQVCYRYEWIRNIWPRKMNIF